MSMQRMLVKATITDTDTEQGTFRAVISTASIDRDGDIVEPVGVVSALHKWAPTGKRVPLSWNHSTAADDIFGHVEPESAAVVGNEVQVDGWMDRDTPRGKDAWRLAKSGTLGFSYGFLILKSAERKGGGLHITELDIFEITATPIPANGDTRVLGWKSLEELKDEADRVALEVEQTAIPDELPPVEEPPPAVDELQEVKSQLAEMRQELEDLKAKQADETGKATESRSVDPLRRQADAVALEVASGDVVLPPIKSVAPPSVPEFSLKELREKMRNEMLGVLSGGSSEQVREAEGRD
jgi:HK97 family phage prohead protease